MRRWQLAVSISTAPGHADPPPSTAGGTRPTTLKKTLLSSRGKDPL